MRLNKAFKDQLAKKVLQETFSKRDAANKEQEHNLAFQCRDKVVGKHKEALLSLPKEMVNSELRFRANIDGSAINLDFYKDCRSEPCPDGRHVIDAKSRLGKSILKWAREREAIKKERRELWSELWALLNNVTTDKKLLELWPEAEQYLPTGPAPVYPLAVRPEDLNKKIEAAKKAA